MGIIFSDPILLVAMMPIAQSRGFGEDIQNVKTKNQENSHGNRYKPLPEPIRHLEDKDPDCS